MVKKAFLNAKNDLKTQNRQQIRQNFNFFTRSALLKLGVDGNSQLFVDSSKYALSQFSQLSWRDNLALLSCLLRSNAGDCTLSRAAVQRFADRHYCEQLSPSEVSMLLSSIWGLKLQLSIPMLEGVSVALRSALSRSASASNEQNNEFSQRTICIVLNTLAFNQVGWEDHDLAKLLAKQLVDNNMAITSSKRVLKMISACARLQLYGDVKGLTRRLSIDLQTLSAKLSLDQLLPGCTTLVAQPGTFVHRLEKFKIEISSKFGPCERLRDEKDASTTCRSN